MNIAVDIVLLSTSLHQEVKPVMLSNQLTQVQSQCKNHIFIVDYCALNVFSLSPSTSAKISEGCIVEDRIDVDL